MMTNEKNYHHAVELTPIIEKKSYIIATKKRGKSVSVNTDVLFARRRQAALTVLQSTLAVVL